MAVLLVGFTMAGCGTNSSSGNINGTWTAVLTNSSDGTTNYDFSATISQGSGGGFSITQFMFTSTSPCFSSEQTTETGSFGLTGNTSGTVQGTFGMTITGTVGNVLALTGVVNGKTITGNWTLSGGGCSGGGTFTAGA